MNARLRQNETYMRLGFVWKLTCIWHQIHDWIAQTYKTYYIVMSVYCLLGITSQGLPFPKNEYNIMLSCSSIILIKQALKYWKGERTTFLRVETSSASHFTHGNAVAEWLWKTELLFKNTGSTARSPSKKKSKGYVANVSMFLDLLSDGKRIHLISCIFFFKELF